MATFTQLEDGDIARLADELGAGRLLRWWPIAAGTINSNFGLETEAGRFVLRINEGKSEDEVRYEAELVDALGQAGVATPRPLASRAGVPYGVHEQRPASMFPWVEGEHRHEGSIDEHDARAVGEALARLHVAGLALAERFARASRYTLEEIAARVDRITATTRLQPDAALVPALDAARAELAWQRARAAERERAVHGIIHGDLFPDNVLFRGPALVALIDFEQASTGSLCYDLAVCLNAWCWDGDLRPALARAMLAGYQAVRPLQPAERQALPVEVRAAAMRFMITRVTDVYLAGQDKVDKDFRHYLRRLERWREMPAEQLLGWADLGE